MVPGTEDGTSPALTVDQAASAFESLFSGDPEETQTPAAPRSAPAESPVEATDDDELPEQPDVDSESDGDEDDAQNDPPPVRKLRVKVDGEEQELPEDEVVKGYSRTADYTRKTQALSEERKAFEAERASVRAERERYGAQLTQLATLLEQSVPAEPDWDAIRKDHPDRFADIYAEWQVHKQRVEAVKAEQTRVMQQIADDRAAEWQKHLAAEQAKLVEALPAWKDAEVAKKERSEIREYALAQGYTSEELSAVTDHRVLLLVRKAMLHDRAEAAKPALRQRVDEVRTAPPGNGRGNKPPVSEVTRAKQRLAKTGSITDAAALFEQMMD